MSVLIKEKIQNSIQAFISGNYSYNATTLFKELGYSSSKRTNLNRNDFGSLFDEKQNVSVEMG